MRKCEAMASDSYCILIRASQSYTTMSHKLVNPDIFGFWHDNPGTPRTAIMGRIAECTKRHR